MLGQTESADVGVFSDRVELPGVAAKPTLVRQCVGDILNQDFLWVWVQRPKPQTGESAHEAVKPIHTQSETRLMASAQFPATCSVGPEESQAVALVSSRPTAPGGCGIGFGWLRPLYFFHTSAKSSVAAASCILMMAFCE